MISKSSKKREIRDLQRLLIAIGVLELSNAKESGRWGSDTQSAVVAVYEQLGWDHPADGTWITSAALAAITVLRSGDLAESVGGPGTHVGGPGMHVGGPGTHVGGPGTHVGGPGTHVGGPGTHVGDDGRPT